MLGIKFIDMEMFLPAWGLFFNSFKGVLSRAEVFNFNEIWFINFSFMDYALDLMSRKSN